MPRCRGWPGTGRPWPGPSSKDPGRNGAGTSSPTRASPTWSSGSAGPEPRPPEPPPQSELFAKVVLALMLGKHADNYLDVQRAAHLQRMRELTEFKRQGGTLDVLLADHALYRLEADLRWIDHTAARLDMIARTVQGQS